MDKQTKPNGKMDPTIHALLTAAVGGYLLYIAYKIYAAPGDMTSALAILLPILFALAGIGTLVYAVRIWRTSRKRSAQNRDDTGKD